MRNPRRSGGVTGTTGAENSLGGDVSSTTRKPVAPQRCFRLSAPKLPETELHEAVARALAALIAPPAMWSTFPAGSVPLAPQFAAKLARMGLQRGWPDVLIVHDGIFGVELKSATGTLSRTRTVRTRRGSLRTIVGQTDVFPRLQRAGMRIAVCRSVDEVLEAMRRWGIPMRGGVR